MEDCLPGVLTEVRSLLDLPAGAERPPRAAVEHTLTTGYAYALGLEGERLKLEERLRVLLRASGRAPAHEVSDLTGQLANAEEELAGVRALLSELRAQALS